MAKLSVDQALLKAQSYAKKGDIEEAQKLYQAVLRAFPKNKRAQHGLALLNKSKQSTPAQTPPQEIINRLVNLYNQGELLDVVGQAQSLTEQYPEAFIIWNILGAAASQIGLLDKAIAAFQRVIAIKPDYADAYNNMGNALKDQGKLEEAIEAYNKALAIKPDYADAYNNMGVALKDQGKPEEAIETYNKALAIKPDYAEAYNNMGNALKDQGKLEEAIEAYNKALAIKPDYAAAYNNMGVALKNQGKLEEAIETYNKALAIKPDYARTLENLVEILKIASSKNSRSHHVIKINKQIKNICKKIKTKNSDESIRETISTAFDFLSVNNFTYMTKLSQIYKRNSKDLNCERHMGIFNSKKIIPEFCFGCYKVQVEPSSVIQLIKLTQLFYELELKYDLTRKCMIELRPEIPGIYKGLIYCDSLDQAHYAKRSLDSKLKNLTGVKLISKIKRGCSEFPITFPEYGKITNGTTQPMEYPKEWLPIEEKFDNSYPKISKGALSPSIPSFCLSDLLIIRKWIDYAKGIGDPSGEFFEKYPIIFEDVYNVATKRQPIVYTNFKK